MNTNNSGPRLGQLCAAFSRRQLPAVAATCLVGAVAGTGFIYLLLWWPDAFPLLPGPPLLDPVPRLIISALLSSVVTIGLTVGLTTIARNQKHRRLRQAEQLAERGEQIRAVRVLNQATGLELEECARLIEAYLAGRPSSSEPRILPEEVRRLAETGAQLQAAERLRELSGIGLPEAMSQVEEYLGVQPWWQDLADDPGQKAAAIMAYRQEHGVDLAEATQVVEEYLRGRGRDHA